MIRDLPQNVVADLDRARRLEWWTLAWMSSVVVVMYFAMGSSQAMKTALIEDVLSLIPAGAFLLAWHYEKKPPTRRFPFGYERVHSLAALIAAVALVGIGGFLLFDSASALLHREHPTIPPVTIMGQEVWFGWLMIAALTYSVIPPVILGRMKQPVARRLQDEVLDTDAMMQKADWTTGLAGIAGVIGIGFGLWWADAVAAGLISFSILYDGLRSLRVATAELIDGSPRALGHDEIAEDAKNLVQSLESHYPGSKVRLRETGRYIHAEVLGANPPMNFDLGSAWPGDPERSWRLVQVSFVPAGATLLPDEPSAATEPPYAD